MKFIYVFLVILVYQVVHIKTERSLSILIEQGIDEFLKNNKPPEYLQNAIDGIFKIKNKSAANKAKCESCTLTTRALLKMRRNGASKETLRQFLENICRWFYISRGQFCPMYVDMYIDTALYIVDNTPELTAERICSIKFQIFGCTDPQSDSWKINIPAPSPLLSDMPTKSSSSDEEHIVHITDIHYDPLYEAGANTVCDFMICCQNTNGKANNSKEGAGYWGDYKACDMPLYSVVNMLQQVKKQHPKIDRVYYTGDTVNHEVWSSTKEKNSEAIKTITKELKQAFETIRFFPVLGNHEAHPTDLFNTINVTDEKLSSQWLLDLVANEWAEWLPSEAQSTLRKGGYYTVLVKPGFRVVGLNSVFCYTDNLWLIYYNKDPHDQLQWLVNILAEAEKNNEKVHLLSHVPPGDPFCLKQWNYEYRRIIDRFSSTITGQFYGHTHADELRIFYSIENPNEVVNVAYIGGSFTSFVGFNPNYRVFHVDATTGKVNDYDEWMYSLQEANQFPDQAPNWYKLYSFKDAYGLEKLDPKNFHELLQKMASNTSLIQQYRRFLVRESPVLLSEPCDKDCLFDLFCTISSVEYAESIQCKEFKAQFDKT